MKKIALLLLAILFPLAAAAQNPDIKKFQEKYADRDGYTVIELTGEMFKIMGKGLYKAGDANSMIGAIDGITSFFMITSELPNDEFSADLKKISSNLTGYKLLASVKESDQSVKFLYKEPENQSKKDGDANTSELIMIVTGTSDNLFMRIRGNFSIKQINSAISGNKL